MFQQSNVGARHAGKVATHPPVTDPETEIAELSREWVEAELLHDRLNARLDELVDQAVYPDRPRELYAKFVGYRQAGDEEWLPLSREFIMRHYNNRREHLLSLLDAYEAECAAEQERVGITALEAEIEKSQAHRKTIERRIIELDATSLQAVILKLRLAVERYAPEMLANEEDMPTDERAARSALDATMRLNSR